MVLLDHNEALLQHTLLNNKWCTFPLFLEEIISLHATFQQVSLKLVQLKEVVQMIKGNCGTKKSHTLTQLTHACLPVCYILLGAMDLKLQWSNDGL